jgi:hypothetical protein
MIGAAKVLDEMPGKIVESQKIKKTTETQRSQRRNDHPFIDPHKQNLHETSFLCVLCASVVRYILKKAYAFRSG